jgi:hypothetical protein
MTEVDWAAQGAAGRRLGDLLAMFGLFNAAHRAGADAKALLHLLSLPLPVTGELVLAAILAAARRPSAIIVAEGAPFDASPKLRAQRIPVEPIAAEGMVERSYGGRTGRRKRLLTRRGLHVRTRPAARRPRKRDRKIPAAQNAHSKARAGFDRHGAEELRRPSGPNHRLKSII